MKSNRVRIFLFCLFAGFLFAASDLTADTKLLIKDFFQTYKGEYVIHVDKNNFTLNVYTRDMKTAASYKIGYGLNPDKKSKLYTGDNRTPEGIYKITEILSMDADKKSASYRKLRDMNSVYFKAKDGHYKFGNKNTDLGKNAYGPRFFRIDYPNVDDKRRYNDAVAKGLVPKYRGKIQSIGAGLAIHGTCDEPSIGHLASSGCIRMFNKDILDLDKYVLIGAPVIITNN